MDPKTYQELAEIIEEQRSIIGRQTKVIAGLLNQISEQENMISVLMKEVE